MSEPKKESELPEEPVDEGKLVGHELIKPEQTGILPEALQSQYKFARVCTLCFIQRKVHQLKILFHQKFLVNTRNCKFCTSTKKCNNDYLRNHIFIINIIII